MTVCLAGEAFPTRPLFSVVLPPWQDGPPRCLRKPGELCTPPGAAPACGQLLCPLGRWADMQTVVLFKGSSLKASQKSRVLCCSDARV